MKRWLAGLLIVVLACVPILTHRETGPHILRDTDTIGILTKIREEQAPLSWFTQDWPLKNHFYRPVSTLAFEADNALYGTNPAGYGLTQALICIGCVLLLFWLCRELTERPPVATAAALLFALWHYQQPEILPMLIAYGAWLLLAMGIIPGRRFWPAALCLLGATFFANELPGMRDIEFKVLDWLPGRTASIMTLFALTAMAAYARFERLGAQRAEQDVSPLDPPATKGSVIEAKIRRSWPWIAVSIVAAALAFGSYEQAVMLPGALLATGLYIRLQGRRVRWAPHLAFWGLLLGYIVLRGSTLGWETSGYQDQQLRPTTLSTLFSITEYAFPALGPTWFYADAAISLGPAVFLTEEPYIRLFLLAATVAAFVIARRTWKLALYGWGLSVVTFLPMAWLNQSDFHHYHYWPMAMRAIFLVAFAQALGKWIVTAASRPVLQAPARPDPAPGSLPRPSDSRPSS